MIKILNILDKYLLISIVFLYPLFFLPIFTNIYLTSKLLILVLGIILISVIKIIKSFLNRNVEFSTSKFDILIILLGLTYLLTGIFVTPNKFDAFFNLGTSSFVMLSCIIYFFVNQLNKPEKEKIEFALIVSTLFSSLTQILSFTGLIKENLFIFENYINNCVFLFTILPIVVYKVFRSEKVLSKVFFGIVGFIIFIAGFTNLYLLLPNNSESPNLLNFKTGWVVAIDTIKVSPLWGIGPSNFLQSFNKNRPLFDNLGSNWNTRYVVSNNTIFTTTTETGLIGLILFLIIFGISLVKPKFDNPYYVSLIIIVISFFIIPVFPSLYPIIFILLSLLINKKNNILDKSNSKTTIFLVTLPLIAIITYVLYFSYITFYPEYVFSRAVKNISKNDNKTIFNGINKAISINPKNDKYHRLATDINLALVRSIIQKKDLTDEEKNNLIKLIQQTIQEAKATVSLNPKNSSHWERLGDIYSNFIPLTKGADDFAIQSYSQAIALNPINPTLRIKLGGVYYGQKRYDEAIKSFELAVLAKNDLPNAHYNLALAYKENKQLEKAIEQMNITLSLLGKDTKDYDTALKELEIIEGLTKPQTISEPVIEPKIELPIDNQNNEG